MDFLTAVHYAKLGYRIKRSVWAEWRWISEDAEFDAYRWMDNVLASDWEVILEGIVSEFPILYADEVIEE